MNDMKITIFATVGTHEQQFDRLLKELDNIASNNSKYDIYVQTGFSDYKLQNCRSSKFLSYQEMDTKIKSSDVVITHGGPASFISVIQAGKTPIVVPRLYMYDEHVNDHQKDFVDFLSSRNFNIVVIDNIDDLSLAIEKVKSSKLEKFTSNNELFVKKLNELLTKYERK